MRNFTAIDFETASGYRNSICQVGLVQVEEGIIANTLNLLVQPPKNYYWSNFIDIHGITHAMTENEPTFDQIGHLVAPFITGKNVVTHNGFGFDFPVLSKTLDYYDLSTPDYNKF
jgi:DNA polymerase-3 subunit epsilon